MLKAIDLRKDFMDNGAFREVLNRIEDKLIKDASSPKCQRKCIVYICEMEDYDKDVYHELIDNGYKVCFFEDHWTVEW